MVQWINGARLELFFYTFCCDTNKDSLMFSFWSIGSPSSDIYPGGGVSVFGMLLTLPTLTLAESIMVVLPGICWLSVASMYGVCCKLERQSIDLNWTDPLVWRVFHFVTTSMHCIEYCVAPYYWAHLMDMVVCRVRSVVYFLVPIRMPMVVQFSYNDRDWCILRLVVNEMRIHNVQGISIRFGFVGLASATIDNRWRVASLFDELRRFHRLLDELWKILFGFRYFCSSNFDSTLVTKDICFIRM